MSRLPSPVTGYLVSPGGKFGSVRIVPRHYVHSGIDIGTCGLVGVSVFAPQDGHVERTINGDGVGSGGAWVRGDDGLVHVFLHLERVVVSAGIRLRRGDVIGCVGNAGSGPHLHYEQHANGEPRDPTPHLMTKGHIKSDLNLGLAGVMAVNVPRSERGLYQPVVIKASEQREVHS